MCLPWGIKSPSLGREQLLVLILDYVRFFCYVLKFSPSPPRCLGITDVEISGEAAVVRCGIIAKCISAHTEHLLKGG